jgi:hypothetical protein
MTPDVIVRAGKFACAGVISASVAFAQPTPAQPAPPPQWTVTGGVESFWWRDVARSGPPVDGSPVSWDGQGPVVYVAHNRGGRSRLHHFEAAFASVGGFVLRSPVRTTPAPDDDGVSRLTGRYEYRRYPWRDLWTTGLDVGIGVDASGEHFSFERHFDPGISLERSLNTVGTALVVAGRWERSSRWSLIAAWGNGLTIGRSTQQYRGDRELTQRGWGGGWQTNLELRGNVRVAAPVLLTAAWFTSGEGRLGSHDSFTYGRSRFTAGVTYAR